MLNALITSGEKTAILTLPNDRFTLQYELAQIGIRKRLTDILIRDDEEQDIQIKLFADSDIGNSLAVLFNPSKVDEAIEKANALNNDEYIDFSAVQAAINAVVRDKNISEQAAVDAMAKAIEDAIDGLERKRQSRESLPSQKPATTAICGCGRHWLSSAAAQF